MLDNHTDSMNPIETKNLRKHWLRIAWRIVRLPLFFYLAVVVVLMFLEESLIFFPSRHPHGFWQPEGLGQEDAWFNAADGTKLHGWFIPQKNPRGVLLFAHGNAGNITHRVERLEFWKRQGVAILIFDYRGYGKSDNASPNEAGILADARAARRWLAERTAVPEKQIVLVGESLGGAVMVDLAAKDSAGGLILESPFSSLPDIAAYQYPWLPVRLIMRNRLNAVGQIHKYQGPLLWSHGTADEIIPYALGRRLFDAANEPKQAVDRPGCEHNGPPYPEDYPPYVEALETFWLQVGRR